MAVVSKHSVGDWCHLCGRRKHVMCDVWYPENAEHGGDDTQYIRVCEKCAMIIAVECSREFGDKKYDGRVL